MMKDIEAGHVDCVIVKRFIQIRTRLYRSRAVDTKDLPRLFQCVFIALTDHFDSLTADYNETSLVVPVKNFVNDSYSRDISGKVRSHQKVKKTGKKNGDFIGAFAVYGYKKSVDNRNLLVPDDYAADIVRKNFHMEGGRIQ